MSGVGEADVHYHITVGWMFLSVSLSHSILVVDQCFLLFFVSFLLSFDVITLLKTQLQMDQKPQQKTRFPKYDRRETGG